MISDVGAPDDECGIYLVCCERPGQVARWKIQEHRALGLDAARLEELENKSSRTAALGADSGSNPGDLLKAVHRHVRGHQ